VSLVSAQEAPAITWQPVLQVRQRVSLTDEGLGERPRATPTVEQNARIGLQVTRLGLSARVSFQDTRTWTGGRDVVRPESLAPALAEGWVSVKGDWTRSVGAEATVGRQTLQLEEGRILGSDPWRMDGQFFDALRIFGHAVPVSFEYVNARRFVEEEDDPLGLGVNVARLGAGHTTPVTRWTADALWVVDARRTADTTSTAGLWVRLDTGRWRSRGEAYLQSGGGGTASLVGLSGGWVIGPNERLQVHLRYDGASGDEPGRTAWRPVLGNSRTFNGLLDRFADPDATGGQGLSDASLLLALRPAPPLRADLTVHRFAEPRGQSPYGYEADGTVHWWFSPFGALEAGGGAFLPSPTFDDTLDLFGYVELNASF
jgi:hypothetical protein